MQRSLSILLILIILISQTGCWNRKELNDLSIVLALGLDETPKGVLLTAQIVNPGETAPIRKGGGGGGERAPVTTFQTTGKTLFEAMRKIQLKIPRKLYGAYIEMIVIGEGLAKKGFQHILDFLLRDHELRSDFFFIIAKDQKASEILNILTSLEKIPTRKLSNSLRISRDVWGSTTTKTLHQLVGEIMNNGKEATLTSVEIQRNSKEEDITLENIKNTQPDSLLVYSDMGVFQKDHLIGWLNQEEGRGFNYTQGEIRSTIESIPCGKNQSIGIEIKKSQTKLTSKIVNGRPQGVVSIHAEGNLGDVECTLEPINHSTIEKLEKQIEQKIQNLVFQSIDKAQSLHADIFGFGEALKRSDPQAWRKLKTNWNKHFTNMPIQVTVDFEIRGSGFLTKPFK